MTRMVQPHTIMTEPAWRPSPKARTLWTVQTASAWAIPIIAVLVWVIVDSEHRFVALAVAAALVVAAAIGIVVVPRWRFRVHRWEVTDEAVYTRVGWFTQESRVAPISRIQTVDTERGPLERLFGLATVTVTTASSAGAVTINELELSVAEQTVAQLTEIAAHHRGDAT